VANDKIRVSAKGAARVLARHPWVYKSDVLQAPQAPGLCVVEAKRTLGFALFSPASEITLRFFDFVGQGDPKTILLDNLRAALARRAAAVAAEPEGAFRLVHGEADLVPALILDYYAGYGVLQVGSAALEPLIPEIAEITKPLFKGLLAKNDQKSRTLEGLPLETKMLWGGVPAEVTVQEGAVRYKVDLQAGQKTGAFIDQRDNRLRLVEFSGQTALDVFSYHGSFALHLCKSFGRVIAVDSSQAALGRSLHNAKLNGFTNLEAVEANAFEFLRAEEKRGAKYDLIVLDPPALAKNKRDLVRAYAAYKEINLRALKLLSKGGILATASCSHHLNEPLFYQMLAEAAADAHATVRVTEKRTQGWDHPVLLGVPETQYLKFALLEVC
jgi:23S rRNA (cytosine1962-C5)-methyltransferase